MKTIKLSGFALAIALSIGFFATSCSDDDNNDPEPLPPIGGYNSADEVGAANLIAYWPLNGNGTESKSSTNPNDTDGVSWVTGAKGQAASLDAGYLAYPTIPALSSTLASFSISTWVNVENNGSTGSVFFTLSRPNEWAGNVNFMAETGWQPSTSDSLTVKGLIVSSNNLGWQDTRNTIKSSPEDLADGHVAYPNKVGGTWAQAVLTWDGTTRLFKVYVNGVKVSNPKWELRGAEDSLPLAFTTPTRAIIGAFETYVDGTSTDTWNQPMTGMIDELRVWNKALVASDINALYELEKAGR